MLKKAVAILVATSFVSAHASIVSLHTSITEGHGREGHKLEVYSTNIYEITNNTSSAITYYLSYGACYTITNSCAGNNQREPIVLQPGQAYFVTKQVRLDSYCNDEGKIATYANTFVAGDGRWNDRADGMIHCARAVRV